MNQRSSNLHCIPLLVLAVFAFVSQSVFVGTHASAQRRPEGRGGDLRTVGSLPSKGKRWALVIGVDNYGLQGAVNDARALRNALVGYAGFPEDQVITLTTGDPDNPPTRNNILSELDRLSRSVPADGLFLFSFSGHGKTSENDAYLIPSDGRLIDSKRSLLDFSIDVTRVREAVEEMKVKQVIMLIDACRTKIVGKGNEAEPLTTVMSRRFSFDETNRDVEAFITLYATRLSESAYEYFDRETGQWRGYFSKAVEEGLSGKAANERGEVTLASLVKYLEEDVPRRSYSVGGIRQVPWKNSSGYKESELVLAVAAARPPASRPAASPWEGIRGTAQRIFKYEYVGEFSEGLARVLINNKWGFINRDGEVVITPQYDGTCSFSEGLACVTLNDKNGYIDRTGKQIIPLKYEGGTRFKEGLAAVGLNDKAGYIDKTGRTVIPFKYDGAGAFSEGLSPVRLGDKHGFINKSGDLVIPAKYDHAGRFSEGLADVGKIVAGGLEEGDAEYNIGYINKSGELVIEMKYNEVGSFSEGMAVVMWHGKQGFINKSGKEVIPLEYDAEDCDCAEFDAGLARVTLNGKYGFVNVRGSEVIPLKYDKVWCDAFRSEGFIGVELGGKKGFVDTYGKEYFNF